MAISLKSLASGLQGFAQLAGGASSAIGSYYGAKSQLTNLNFQADVSKLNARLAELDARAELKKGQQLIGALTMRAGQMKGRQRAALAASGIDLSEGSAAEALASTDLLRTIDVNTLQANSIRSAWGYRGQAANFGGEATMRAASARGISPRAAAASSLLGSAGGVLDSWYRYQRDGR